MASNLSSGLQNSTQSRYGGQFDIKFHTGLILISSLIITSNGLVIVLFATMENLRKAGKLLLLSLAISDLTTGLVTIPLNISCEVTFSAPLCLASSTLNRFIGISTVYHILAVTFETYYAILRPMEHRVKVERSKVLGLVFGMWFAALLTALTPLYWTLGVIKNVRGIPSKEFLRKQAIYEIVVFITGFFLPLALMVFAHMRMFAKILDALKLLRSRSSPLSQPTYMSKYKTALLFAVILLVFTLSWSFWFIISLLKAIGSAMHPFPLWATDSLTIIRYSTSFINPLLYTFFRPDFYKAFKSFVTRKEGTRRQSVSVTYLLHGGRFKRDSQTNSTFVRETSVGVALHGNSAANNDTRM